MASKPKRSISISDLGPRKRGTCTWCKGAVTPPKRYWCSSSCVHEYKIRADIQYARVHVWIRDKGVCIECGLNTDSLLKAFNDARSAATADVEAMFEALGFKLDTQYGQKKPRHMWEQDHVIPVVEGGGACGLDNLVTLCTNCHKRKTSREATERAAKRKL